MTRSLLLAAFACLGGPAIAAGPVVLSMASSNLSVTLIDAATRQPLGAPIPLPDRGNWIAVEPDGKQAFILMPCPPPGQPGFGCGPGKLAVLDVAKHAVVDTIELGPDVGKAIASPDRSVFYFVHDLLGIVTAVSTRTGELRVTPFAGIFAAALAPDGQILYLIAGGDIVVMRAADFTVVDRFPISDNPIDVLVTPDGRNLLMLGEKVGPTGSVSLLDLATRQVTWRIDAAQFPTYPTLDGTGKRAFSSNWPQTGVNVIDLALGTVQNIPLDRSVGRMDLSPDGRELWVMNPVEQSITVLDAATLETQATITGLAGANSAGPFIGPLQRPPGSTRVAEYFNPTLQHYFITASPQEMAALDRGIISGWGRTGQVFFADATGSESTEPVCRYYGLPAAGLDSHFYSASRPECDAVARLFGDAWIKETDDAFRIGVPDSVTGICPGSGVPVWRLWNARVDSNHRYTTSPAIRDAMIASGFVAEGYGPSATAMCGMGPY